MTYIFVSLLVLTTAFQIQEYYINVCYSKEAQQYRTFGTTPCAKLSIKSLQEMLNSFLTIDDLHFRLPPRKVKASLGSYRVLWGAYCGSLRQTFHL